MNKFIFVVYMILSYTIFPVKYYHVCKREHIRVTHGDIVLVTFFAPVAVPLICLGKVINYWEQPA